MKNRFTHEKRYLIEDRMYHHPINKQHDLIIDVQELLQQAHPFRLDKSHTVKLNRLCVLIAFYMFNQLFMNSFVLNEKRLALAIDFA
ncbi:MAG: hypothetical protein RI991_1147 [Bacteroidota bacterium]